MSTHAGEEQVIKTRQAGETTPVAGVAGGILVLAATYLAVSPWIVQTMSQFGLAASDIVVGLVLVFLAVSVVRSGPRIGSFAWVLPVLGAWAAVSPWLIYNGPGLVPTAPGTTPPLVMSTWLSNVVAGAVIVVSGGILAARAGRPVRNG